MVYGAAGGNWAAKWMELCTSQISSHEYRNSKVPVIAPVGEFVRVLKRKLAVFFSSLVVVFFQSAFSSPLRNAHATDTIFTMTDHHCQHWLKKKQPSSPCVPQVPCSTSPPRATVISAHQAEVQSTLLIVIDYMNTQEDMRRGENLR